MSSTPALAKTASVASIVDKLRTENPSSWAPIAADTPVKYTRTMDLQRELIVIDGCALLFAGAMPGFDKNVKPS